MNIVQTIRDGTASLLDKTAVVEGALCLTYGQLHHAVDRVADELRARGISPAQRIAILADDSIDYVIANLAVLSLSAVVVPISTTLTKREITTVIENINVHYVLAEKKYSFEKKAVALMPDGFCSREFLLSPCRSAPPMPSIYYELNPAFIRFSSGTTGASKGVLLSHEAIHERTAAANAGLEMTSQDVVLWVLSMSYHFVVSILLFLRQGATIVLAGTELPFSLVECAQRHHGTFIYASPFHYHILASTDAVPADSLANIRLAISTAMHLPSETAEAFRQKFSFSPSGAYGIIEVGLPFINASQDPEKAASVGKPLPSFELNIRRPTKDGIGEIYLRGKGMFDAYFAPWRVAADALHDGWFKTGDLGHIDHDGYLFIVGRENSVINFAGMKIFPSEVEDVLNEHPAIKESLVYPVPHPQYGHLPCAKVVPAASADPTFNADQVRRFCFSRLASFKVPKEFEMVERLERTASNKLRRA